MVPLGVDPQFSDSLTGYADGTWGGLTPERKDRGANRSDATLLAILESRRIGTLFAKLCLRMQQTRPGQAILAVLLGFP